MSVTLAHQMTSWMFDAAQPSANMPTSTSSNEDDVVGDGLEVHGGQLRAGVQVECEEVGFGVRGDGLAEVARLGETGGAGAAADALEAVGGGVESVTQLKPTPASTL